MDDDTNPAHAVESAVRESLELMDTWVLWDGSPRASEDLERVYTPHKAVRRIADHLIDHLAQVEAMLAGEEPPPDNWTASNATFDSDWARFTELDRREARERIERLVRTLVLRYRSAGPDEWDRPRGSEWTLRQVAEHLDSTFYARQVGDLTATSGGGRSR